MKIVFITQEDPFYVRLFFEEFLAHYERRTDIAAVVIAPAMGKKSVLRLARQMLDFYGPIDFVAMGFKFVTFKLADKLSRWLPRVFTSKRAFSIDQVCERASVPVWHVPNVNAPEFVARLRAQNIDLVVSVAAPQIFKAPLIAVPKHGCINIHNSKLPRYRGMLPNFWQMFHGEKASGTTIHRVNESLDDGAILLQTETAIEPGESLESLICRTKRAGALLMIKVLEQIRTGTVQELANPRESASYFTFPTRQDVREFRRRGYRLV